MYILTLRCATYPIPPRHATRPRRSESPAFPQTQRNWRSLSLGTGDAQPSSVYPLNLYMRCSPATLTLPFPIPLPTHTRPHFTTPCNPGAPKVELFPRPRGAGDHRPKAGGLSGTHHGVELGATRETPRRSLPGVDERQPPRALAVHHPSPRSDYVCVPPARV